MEEDLSTLSILIVENSPDKIGKFRREYAQHDLCVTHSGDATIEMLECLYPDVLFLGHDEAGAIARWLAEHETMRPARMIIHALDPEVARNIQGMLPGAEWYPLALSRPLPDFLH